MSAHQQMTGWTPTEVEYIKRLWREGKSASECAQAVFQSFGVERSRNSIIGKIHRLGLTGRDQANKAAARAVTYVPRKPRPAAQRPIVKPRKKVASLGKAPKVVGIDYKLTPATEKVVAACAAYGRDRVAWVESGAGVQSLNARPFFEGSGCKWPLSGGMRCCNSISRGQYCEGHAAVAYEKAQPKIDSKFMSRHDGVIDKYRPAQNTDRTLWDEARLAA